MAKPFKIFLIVSGSLLALLLVAAVALPLLFDPNNFRTQIAESVKKETGRDFAVGDIKLKVFPWLRVALSDARLGNAEGFGDQPFAEVGQLGVGVKLMPLLTDHQVQVSSLTLDGLSLNLAKDKNGRSNWQDLIDRQSAKEEQPKEQGETDSSIKLKDIDIAGISITDASLRYSDAQAGKAYSVNPLNLEIGALQPGKPFDVKLDVTTTSDKPKATAELELSTRITPDLEGQRYTLDDVIAKIKANGEEMGLDADGTLKLQLIADVGAQTYSINGLDAQLQAQGKSIPGGKQSLKLGGALKYDQKADSMNFDQGRIEAAGLVVTTTIKGSGLSGDHPKLSGPIAIAPFSPRELLKILDIPLETADNTALSNASLKANYSGSFSSAALDGLELKLDDTHVNGRLAVTNFDTQALEFALKADAINADRYLPPKSEGDSAEKPAGDDSDINQIKLPTEALEKLNANGTLDIGKLTLNGVKMSDVRLKLSGGGNAPRVQDLSAQMYGGTVKLNNRFAPGQKTPSYALKTDLNALNAAPFLQDLLGKDIVSGLGNLKLDLTSSGQTVGELRQGLNGSVAFNLQNGAVKGFNLGQILRQSQALLAGQAAPSETGAKETDFAAFSASATIVNGVLRSDDLAAASPLFRMAGSGQIDLVKETINYVARPTVVETSTGQGGKGLEELKGLTIPIKLSGNLFSPKYKLDIEDALKDKAKDKLKERIADELNLPEGENSEEQIKQKLNDKLGDLLFGKKKKNKPAEPAAEPASEAAPAPDTAPDAAPAAADAPTP
ncbi:AsmA family protein [Sinimarinibacterium sp. CAU 1509]|uniref:AsmA family protein n=1 Tax=Sinimarinibacterium sp. CAU 1509 TaxID=2562283 RepID=UPI0010ACC772|nr:AsmA family protein [Sinimarinibacterium sp. CAU 1509]TJY63217.1 AsmA family protein [Sinimarinibacterium sp. CAU 1509]